MTCPRRCSIGDVAACRCACYRLSRLPPANYRSADHGSYYHAGAHGRAYHRKPGACILCYEGSLRRGRGLHTGPTRAQCGFSGSLHMDLPQEPANVHALSLCAPRETAAYACTDSDQGTQTSRCSCCLQQNQPAASSLWYESTGGAVSSRGPYFRHNELASRSSHLRLRQTTLSCCMQPPTPQPTAAPTSAPPLCDFTPAPPALTIFNASTDRPEQTDLCDGGKPLVLGLRCG